MLHKNFAVGIDIGLEDKIVLAGIEHEENYRQAARYIERRATNNIGHVVYDPSTGARWWRLEEAPDGWWVPFETVVPGTGGYADVPLTVYLRSATGMEAVDCIHHVRDFHVTLLRLLGLDDNRLTYYHAGRFKQLSQFGGQPIKGLIA